MPFSAFLSSATNCVTYFRRQCSSERTGKWRISNGNQPRSATSPSPNASWLPRPMRTSAHGSVRRLEVRAERVRMEGSAAEPDGHPLGEELGARLGTGHEVPPGAAHRRRSAPGTTSSTSFRLAPCGHQNSSASALITQSAPNSVAASRAIRVTHSVCRRSSPGSRMRWSTPSASQRSRISVVASTDRLSVATTKSTPASDGTRSARPRCRPRRGRAGS